MAACTIRASCSACTRSPTKDVVVRVLLPNAMRVRLSDARRRARARARHRAVRVGRARAASITTPYRIRWQSYDGALARELRPVLVPARRSTTAISRASPPAATFHAHRFLGRARAHDRRRARHALRRVGAERRARQRGRHVQSLGRPLSSDERARRLGRLGAVHPRASDPASSINTRSSGATAASSSSRPIPYGAAFEHRPATASRHDVAHARSRGTTATWLERRAQRDWLHGADLDLRSALGLLAPRPSRQFPELPRARAQLGAYVADLGFTHVELLPITEHPFDDSWGYQCTGYFAPTSRHGSPDELRELVAELHRHGIGVLLDWVPGHFPKDDHALARFDGTALYEYARHAEGRAPRLGHARLQLHAQRGAELPAVERDLLARRLPLRRAARRRRRVDAVSRLLAQAAPVDAESSTAATRISRRSRS